MTKSKGIEERWVKMDKVATGIPGLDEITGGGLPRGRTTLLSGAAGSGKTVLSLQILVDGAQNRKESAIFVAFEESPDRIVANAAGLGWDLRGKLGRSIFILDARPTPDIILAGGFDLGGMLVAIDAKIRETGARRVVFDALDVILGLMDSRTEQRRQIYQLHEWLIERGLTAIVTAKEDLLEGGSIVPPMSSLQFMVDCVISLNHQMVEGVSQRNLRVIKYRGSGFGENQAPFLIGESGLEVAGMQLMAGNPLAASQERVSSGAARLDTMLGGGYFRSASVLITGAPGTAKSSLCGAFADAACARGEKTLYVSFDSEPAEIVRNLESVKVRLARHMKKGLLKLVSLRKGVGSAEVQFMRIRSIARDHGARNLVIDPVSALCKSGNASTAYSVVERLTDWVKTEGITLVCASLLDSDHPGLEGTPMEISTIADTWIHLSYLVNAGERNRSLTIVKSRGTSHSNQVRELVLSEAGITLTDVYTSGGEVLMGSLRWEREQQDLARRQLRESEVQRRLAEVELAELEIRSHIEKLEHELQVRRRERELLEVQGSVRARDADRWEEGLRKLRSADLRGGKSEKGVA